MARTVPHPALGSLTVGPVDPEATFALRQEVLRPHQRIDEMSVVDSDDTAAVVVAARTADGTVVATGTVMPAGAPPPAAGTVPSGPYWRLRAMATRADVRGTGLGSEVLGLLLDHVAQHGGGVVWCAARVPAVAFYRRAGFETSGTSWVDPAIGPHVHMWSAVAGASGPGG